MVEQRHAYIEGTPEEIAAFMALMLGFGDPDDDDWDDDEEEEICGLCGQETIVWFVDEDDEPLLRWCAHCDNICRIVCHCHGLLCEACVIVAQNPLDPAE